MRWITDELSIRNFLRMGVKLGRTQPSVEYMYASDVSNVRRLVNISPCVTNTRTRMKYVGDQIGGNSLNFKLGQ